MTTLNEIDAEIGKLTEEAARFDLGLPPVEQVADKTPSGDAETQDDVVDKVTTESTKTADSTDKGESGNEDKADDKVAGQGEKQTSKSADATAGDKTDDAKATRTEKKEVALERTWSNAEKRHKEAEARELSIIERERVATEKEQRIAQLSRQVETSDDPLPKYSFEDLAKSVSDFITEGDVATAKQLAASMAAKAQAQIRAATPGLHNPKFVAAWEQTRNQVIKANPELADPKSPLYAEASGLLSGDWATFFQSHPQGIAAAVEVAKLRLQVGQETGMADKVKTLESENQSLRKKLQLDGASTTSREVKSIDFDSLPLEKQMEMLQKEADRIDRGH